MTGGWICVDASLVLRLLLAGSDTHITSRWLSWEDDRAVLVAPTLIYYEVANALHRYAARGDLLPEEAAAALDSALALDIELHGDAGLHRRALELARLHSLPAAYDAHYLAVAERFQAEFWTADRRLERAVQPTLPWVRLLD